MVCGGRIDAQAGESEIRSALASDAPWDADRASGSRYQSHRHFGKLEEGVLRSGHLAGEGRKLDARTDAGSLQLGAQPVGAVGEQASRVAGGSDGVGGSRVGEGAELVEVSAAAEGGSGSAEDYLLDRRIVDGDPESLHQGVAHLRGEGVPLLRSVQRELEPGAGSTQENGRLQVRLLCWRGGSRRQPLSELRSALKRGVHQGLRDQPLVDVEACALPEQLDQRHGCEWCAPGGDEDRLELLLRAHHDVEVVAERSRCRARAVAIEGHGGAGKGGESSLCRGDRFGTRRSSIGVEGDQQDRLAGQRREVFGGVGRLQSLDRLRQREDRGLRFAVYVPSPNISARSFRRSSFPSSL